jgi:hypothetical protein
VKVTDQQQLEKEAKASFFIGINKDFEQQYTVSQKFKDSSEISILEQKGGKF